MVIFHSYVSLPEGIYQWFFSPYVPTYGRATAQPPEPQQTDGAPNAYRAGEKEGRWSEKSQW